MSGPVGLYKPDAIPMVGLAGRLRIVDDELASRMKMRVELLARMKSIDVDVYRLAHERDELAALLAADEQQLEVEDV